MSFGYPVVLDLEGVAVLVVGGGRVAARKAAGLAEAGARVTVIAPEVLPELVALAVRVERRAYEPGDLAGQRLVMTATDDSGVNAAVAHDARREGIWVNSADDPANCTFILPAVTRSGPVVVAVGTDGSSPALARHLRDEIARDVLGPHVEDAARELARQRDELHAAGVSTESIDWGERVRLALVPRGDGTEGGIS